MDWIFCVEFVMDVDPIFQRMGVWYWSYLAILLFDSMGSSIVLGLLLEDSRKQCQQFVSSFGTVPDEESIEAHSFKESAAAEDDYFQLVLSLFLKIATVSLRTRLLLKL